jgi:hypothetical protein
MIKTIAKLSLLSASIGLITFGLAKLFAPTNKPLTNHPYLPSYTILSTPTGRPSSAVGLVCGVDRDGYTTCIQPHRNVP